MVYAAKIETNKVNLQDLYPKGSLGQCIKMTGSNVGWGTCGSGTGGNGGTLGSLASQDIYTSIANGTGYYTTIGINNGAIFNGSILNSLVDNGTGIVKAYDGITGIITLFSTGGGGSGTVTRVSNGDIYSVVTNQTTTPSIDIKESLIFNGTIFNTNFAGRSTTNLAEGTNFYYTGTRVNGDVAQLFTTNGFVARTGSNTFVGRSFFTDNGISMTNNGGAGNPRLTIDQSLFGTGSVTSVTVKNGDTALSFTGNPITSSGTIKGSINKNPLLTLLNVQNGAKAEANGGTLRSIFITTDNGISSSVASISGNGGAARFTFDQSLIPTAVTPGGSNGQLQIRSNSTTFAGSNTRWDTVNGRLALRHSAPDTVLDVNGAVTLRPGTTTPSAPDSGAANLWLGGNSAANNGDLFLQSNIGSTPKIVRLYDYTLNGVPYQSVTVPGVNSYLLFNDGSSGIKNEMGANGAVFFNIFSRTLGVSSSGNFDVDGNVNIADTDITLDGSSTTFTQTIGAVTMTPANGSNMNVNLRGAGLFSVDTGRLTVVNAGNVGVADFTPDFLLDVNGQIGFNSASINGNTLSIGLANQGAILFSRASNSLSLLDNGNNGTVLGVVGAGKRLGYITTSSGTGDVTGPSASVINGIPLFSATTGKAIKNSGIRMITRSQSSLYIGNGAGANANGTTLLNTALGTSALAGGTNFTADNNVAIGFESGRVITTGSQNTLVGLQSGEGITTGSGNTIVGRNALQTANQLNLTGSNNTCIGDQACFNLQSVANGNTAIGSAIVFNSLSSSSRNTLLGYRTGDAISTGSNNVLIGYDIDAPVASGVGQLSIANLIYGNGNTATSTTVSSGKVGIKDPTPSFDLDVNGTTFSKVISTPDLTTSDTNISLTGTSTTFTQTTGAITMVPASGSNFNVTTAGIGDFAINTSQLVVNNNGDVGIGVAAPSNTFRTQIAKSVTSNNIGTMRQLGIGVDSSVGYNLSLGYGFSSVAFAGVIQPYDNSLGSQLLLNPVGGNVGIFDYTPDYKLDVNGSLNATSININGSAIPITVYKVKSAQQTTTGTTLVNDDTLFGSVSASKKYIIELFIVVQCPATNGCRIAIGGPKDSKQNYYSAFIYNGNTATTQFNYDQNIGFAPSVNGGNLISYVPGSLRDNYIRYTAGMVTAGGNNGGTFQVYFANNTGTGNNVAIREGSYIKIIEAQ